MAKVKVSVDFSTHNFSDKELNVKSASIVVGLTDNPNFPTLTDAATQIKTKNDIFGELLIKMGSGNKQVTAEKNNTRTDLEGILKSTAMKVQDISEGDDVKILSSGFDINRKSSPVGVLDQPVNVQVKQGQFSGSLEISWDVVDHAYSYEIRYTKSPKTDASIFTNITATKRKTLVENLTLGQTYLIQIAGVGSDPKRVWSVDVISCYVS